MNPHIYNAHFFNEAAHSFSVPVRKTNFWSWAYVCECM